MYPEIKSRHKPWLKTPNSTICCCCSITHSCLTLCNLWAAACQASLPFTIFWSLLKLMSIESVMPSKHIVLLYPLLFLSSIFLRIRVFFNESNLCIRWPKYWSFSFSINPSNEYSELISFRIDWLDLLAVQGALKEYCPTPQFKSINSLKLSIFLWSNSHTHTWLHTAWTICESVDKVMSLLFNILSRLVMGFLPRSKHLLILFLQSPSTVILDPKEIVCHCFHCLPIYFPWSDGSGFHDLCFLNVEF